MSGVEGDGQGGRVRHNGRRGFVEASFSKKREANI